MQDLSLVGSHWLISPVADRLGRARRAVHDLLVGAGVDGECQERAVIACDELLTNAIAHVAVPAVLSVCVAPEHVRVAVTDPGRVDPLARWRCHRMSGLSLVGQLCRDLYVETRGNGKTVAAEISRCGHGSATSVDMRDSLRVRLGDPGDRWRPGAG